MKRAGNLYRGIHSTSNLVLALRRALRGKRHKSSSIRFLAQCRDNLRLVQQKLSSRSWYPDEYNTFTIHEPKERLITAAPFEDRVVHHAIMNMVEPHLERFSIHDSYACRRGKGLHTAIARARTYQRRYAWFLKLDIRKYFDSIDHSVLKCLLVRRFKDRDLVDLFSRIIDSASTRPGKGLPIGNLTSQHFANFYLGHLDHSVKDTLGRKAYVRYMDDFCVWSHSKADLQEVKMHVEEFLNTSLRLTLKETATRLAPVSYGMPFLGFRVFPHTIRMKRETLRRFVRKLRRYDYFVRHGLVVEDAGLQAIQSLYSFVRVADSTRFLHNFASRLAA